MLPFTVRAPKGIFIFVGGGIPARGTGVCYVSLRSINQAPVRTPIQFQRTGFISVELSMAQLLGVFQGSRIIKPFPLVIHKN
jgi:hypothetical protein